MGTDMSTGARKTRLLGWFHMASTALSSAWPQHALAAALSLHTSAASLLLPWENARLFLPFLESMEVRRQRWGKQGWGWG
jgi:hypothetical protein